jgi:hypothetical protein
MSEVPNNGTQSGGLNLSSGTFNTSGGDATGRDKVVAGGNYVAVVGDKSHEDVVNILREELREKNKQITVLQSENTLLNSEEAYASASGSAISGGPASGNGVEQITNTGRFGRLP